MNQYFCKVHNCISNNYTECSFAGHRPDKAIGECVFIDQESAFKKIVRIAEFSGSATQLKDAIKESMKTQNFDALCNLATVALHEYCMVDAIIRK